jgi:hypothetical protein
MLTWSHACNLQYKEKQLSLKSLLLERTEVYCSVIFSQNLKFREIMHENGADDGDIHTWWKSAIIERVVDASEARAAIHDAEGPARVATCKRCLHKSRKTRIIGKRWYWMLQEFKKN